MEAVRSQFKSSKLSNVEKLQLALELKGRTIYINGSDEMLLEWLVNYLYNQSKDSTIEHWTLLRDLITSAATEKPILPLIFSALSLSSLNAELLCIIVECFTLCTVKSVITMDQLLNFTLNIVTDSPDIAMDFVKQILEYSIKEQLQSSNQKKLFTFAVQKLLTPFAALTRRKREFLQVYEAYYIGIVFHREHLVEFSLVLQDLNNQMTGQKKQIQSYPKLFFVMLKEMKEPGTFFYSKILELFVSALKRKGPDFEKTAFIMYCQLQNNLNDFSDLASHSLDLVILTEELLITLKTLAVYRPGNDELALKQSAFLSTQYEKLFNLVACKPEESFQRSIISSMNSLLSLDFLIISKDLSRPSGKCQEVSLQYMTNILQSYVKARELPLLFLTALEIIRNNGWLEREGCIILTPTFLERFDKSIGSILPSQSMDLIVVLKDYIMTSIVTVAASKKMKKVSVESTEAATTLFIHAIINAQINETRKQAFDDFLIIHYNEYTAKVIGMVESSEGKEQKKIMKRLLYPALHTHLVFIQESEQYWRASVNTQSLLSLNNVLAHSYSKLPKLHGLLVELLCHHLDRLISTGTLDREDLTVKEMLDEIWNLPSESPYQNSIISTHIWNLCSISSVNQVSSFVERLMDRMASSYDEDSAILNFAPFFEIPSIRDIFLKTFLETLGQYLNPKLAKLINKFSQYGSISWSKLMQYFQKYSGTTAIVNGVPVINLLKAIQLIPVLYFQPIEREVLQFTTYLLERHFDESDGCLLSRLLTWRYMKAREDRILTLHSPSIFLWCIKSRSNYQIIMSEAQFKLFNTTSLCSQVMTFKKLFERIGSTLQKEATDTSESFLDQLLEHFKEAGDQDVQSLTTFWAATNLWIKGGQIETTESILVLKKLDKLAKATTKIIEKTTDQMPALLDQLLYYFQSTKIEKILPLLTNLELRMPFGIKTNLEATALLLKWSTTESYTPTKSTQESRLSLILAGHNGISLESVLTTLFSRCSTDDYQTIFNIHMNFLSTFKYEIVNHDREIGVLKGLILIAQNGHSILGRSLVYQSWATMLLHLTQIIQSAPTMDYLEAAFKIATFVAKDQSFELSVGEVSMMMSLIQSIGTNIVISKDEGVLEIFDLIYELLYSIVRHRREEVLNLIPAYFDIISSMLDCFTAATLTSRKNDKQFKALSLNLLSPFCPLPVSYAKKVTRLLGQMSQKPAQDTSKVEPTKPFSKYSPFLLARLLDLNGSSKVNMEEEWELCCFACLDCCDDYGRAMVLAGLNGALVSLRPVYKNLVGNWDRQHKFQGRA